MFGREKIINQTLIEKLINGSLNLILSGPSPSTHLIHLTALSLVFLLPQKPSGKTNHAAKYTPKRSHAAILRGRGVEKSGKYPPTF